MPGLKRLRHGARALLDLLLLQGASWRWLGYGLSYLMLMTLAVWRPDPLKELDWELAERLALRDKAWPAMVELVDLGWNMDPAGLLAHRLQLLAALEALGQLPRPPQMVVIDIALAPLPLAQNPPLKEAVRRLSDQGSVIIASVDLNAFRHVETYDDGLRRNSSREVYAGQAVFGHSLFSSFGRSFWYQPCEVALASDERCLPAIPVIVGSLRQDPNEPVQASASDSPILVQPGLSDSLSGHRWSLKSGQLVADAGDRDVAQLSNKVVIIGNLAHDRVNGLPGPELLGWAIGDNITPSPAHQPRLLALLSPGWALGFALLFSGVTLMLFRAGLRALSQPQQHLASLTLGSLVGSLLLLGLGIGLLRHALHAAFWQLSYVLLAMLITAFLAWHAARARLRDQAMYTSVSASADPQAPSYDVFISYSHSPRSNRDWVLRELVEPLQALQLKVFFDERSIHIGTAWYFELAMAIERSRCMVAVYSDDYFRKNFCRFELGKAVVRDIVDQRRSFHVLPFLRDASIQVPTEFSHLQYELIGERQQMISRIVDTLRRSTTTPQAPPG